MTKEKFLAFEKIRRSGKTNMFAVRNVVTLSKYILNEEDCLESMKHYAKFKAKYL